VKGFREHMTEHGSRTLGEHLHRIGGGELNLPQTIRQKGEARRVDGNQIRGRFLLRKMIAEEFDQIYNEQCKHISQLRDEKLNLRNKLRGIIVNQRDVTWSKRLIGRCECLPKLPRCPRANWHAQQFRIYKEVNNLRIHNADGSVQELTERQRKKLVDTLSKSEKLEFSAMRDIVGNMIDSQIFNLEEGPRAKRRRGKGVDQVRTTRGRISLKGNSVEAALREVFKERWEGEFDETQRDEIRQAVTDISDAEELLARGINEWGLTEDDARLIATMELATGYMSYSLEALKRMVEAFRMGLETEGGIKEYEARERCGFNEKTGKRVYKLLPLPVKRDRRPLTNNPLVNRALHEVRKVVNAIIREYGKPDKIVVELWREMKGSLRQRAELVEWQNANRDEKEQIRRRLSEDFPEVFKDYQPSGGDVLAYRLWLQQGGISPYSGKNICRTDLARFFAGQGVLHIDHILPKKRSNDDGMNNKCLCFLSENDEKREQTPREWLEGMPEYEAMIVRIGKMAEHGMPWSKRRKFSQKEIKLDEFVKRQMNDSAFISRAVRKYLQCLFPGDCEQRDQKVKAARGGTTAAFRWQWGLDSILDSSAYPKKDRTDLRHNAIDAIVIALTNEKRLWELAHHYRRPGEDSSKFEPWPRFRQEVEVAIGMVNVSHRVRRKIRGQLHDETYYGKPTKDGKYPYRKTLTDLTWAEIDNDRIRDERIRSLIKARVAQFRKRNENTAESDNDEENGSESKKPPGAAWNEPLFLLRKDGTNGSIVKRVRLEKSDSTIRDIRKGQRLVYVKPGNTHHLCLFIGIKCPPGEKERDAVFIDLLTATQRKIESLASQKRGTPPVHIVERTLPDHPEAEFWMSLSSGEMVLLDPDDPTTLYRYETSRSTTKQLQFRKHSAAAIGSNGLYRPRPWTLKPSARKVTVDPLGRIRWAND
jgi:CRISPR-associated endonuclease Csn1